MEVILTKEVFEVMVDIEVNGKAQPAKATVESSNHRAAINRFVRELRKIYGTENVYETTSKVKKVNDSIPIMVAETVDEIVDTMATIKVSNLDVIYEIASTVAISHEINGSEESVSEVLVPPEMLKLIAPIKINFLDDTKSELLIEDRRYQSRIEVVKLPEGFYLVTKLTICTFDCDKYCDRLMLTRLRVFSEINRITVVLTDLGKYCYLTWTTLRNIAINSRFQVLGGKQRCIIKIRRYIKWKTNHHQHQHCHLK